MRFKCTCQYSNWQLTFYTYFSVSILHGILFSSAWEHHQKCVTVYTLCNALLERHSNISLATAPFLCIDLHALIFQKFKKETNPWTVTTTNFWEKHIVTESKKNGKKLHSSMVYQITLFPSYSTWVCFCCVTIFTVLSHYMLRKHNSL